MPRTLLIAAIMGVFVGVLMGLRHMTTSVSGRAALACAAGFVVAIAMAFLRKKNVC